MNPNEIKQALECLCGEELFCRECNYSGHIYYPECRQQVAKDTIAYINQLEAEVEQLKANSDSRQTNKNKNIDIAHIKAKAVKAELKEMVGDD